MGDFRWIKIANFATVVFRAILEFIAGLNGGDEQDLRRRVSDVLDPDSPTERIDDEPPQPKQP